MNSLEKIGKKKTILISISVIMVSLHTIYFYHSVVPEAGTKKVMQQLIRFILTLVLLVMIYKGKSWARKISIVLFSIGALGSIVSLLTIDNSWILKTPLLVMAIVYSAAIYHLKVSKSFKAFYNFQNGIGNKEEIVYSEEEQNEHYELKQKGLEAVLGTMHPTVGHAIIPFSVGGSVDMYYFPNHIKGTGFATMELINPAGKGPFKNRYGTYELVAFTKYSIEAKEDNESPFHLIERKACGFLTAIANYSSMAVLNPKETIEVPNGEAEANTCMIFDLYEPKGEKFKIGNSNHHLLLCMQLHRSEMEYARKKGSDALFTILKEKGIYPYSDLDRDAVV